MAYVPHSGAPELRPSTNAFVKGQEALLFSISYYLTGKLLASCLEDIGKGWRYMTVLLRLQEQNGKVLIEQDDSCLGNPNSYGSIAAARKALVRCHPATPK